MQYFSIWVKAAKSLLLIYYQCTFSDSAVVLKQQSQMLLEQWIWTDCSCNDFFLLPERGGCVMRYLVQPVDGLQERTKLLVFHTWAPLRWSGSDTEHWSVGSGMAHPAQQWAVPDRSKSPVQTSVPPWGSRARLHSAAASSCGWYPRKPCAVEPQSMPEWEPGEQDCVLISATDSLWLQTSHLLDIYLFPPI